LIGTTTNDNAAAGQVGEYVSSTITGGASVALTPGVATNITSISLTAGDWDVSIMGYFTGTPTTIFNNAYVAATTSSATLDTTPGVFAGINAASAPYLTRAALRR